MLIKELLSLLESRKPERSSWAIMKGHHFDSPSVNLETIRSENGDNTTALLCKNDKNKLFWIIGAKNTAHKLKDVNRIHDDQSWRDKGYATIVGIAHLGKTTDEDKIEVLQIPDNKDIRTIKVPVFVFK